MVSHLPDGESMMRSNKVCDGDTPPNAKTVLTMPWTIRAAPTNAVAIIMKGAIDSRDSRATTR